MKGRKANLFQANSCRLVANRIWHILIYKLNSCVLHMSIHSRLSLCLKVELILVVLGESFSAF